MSIFEFLTHSRTIKLLERIMSAISDFAAKQGAHNAAVSAALDGISEDIAALNALIAKLQATTTPISAEDQATLDELDAAGAALQAKADAINALTPPATPVENSGGGPGDGGEGP